jgi:two-component system response regulator ChvI
VLRFWPNGFVAYSACQEQQCLRCPSTVASSSFHTNVSRVQWNDIDVGLTIGEYHIVHLLASNVGRWVTYRAIYDRLHYEGFIAGNG